MRMTDAEIELHDKRLIAVHEAGHATVATVLGVTTWAYLYRTNTRDLRSERLWAGKTGFLNQANAIDMAVISVAGIVAECLANDPADDANTIFDYWECDAIEPSPTDYAGIPDSREARRSAVERAVTILRDCWGLLEKIMAALLNDEVVTDWQIVQFAQQFEHLKG